MKSKPTYQELENRIKELEELNNSQSKINISTLKEQNKEYAPLNEKYIAQ